MVAVVCTGGEVPPSFRCLSWLDSANLTVAADGGLSLLKQLGRKADLWVGDGDSLEGSLKEWAPWYEEAQVLPRAKDDTDTGAAVQLALERGAQEVWLVGGGGGRMDHWWSNLRLAATQPALTRWLTAHEECWNLRLGDNLTIPQGTVSIFPLGLGPWRLRSSGLRWTVDTVDFRTWHSLGNEVPGESAQLEVEAGCFLVMLPWEGEPIQ